MPIRHRQVYMPLSRDPTVWQWAVQYLVSHPWVRHVRIGKDHLESVWTDCIDKEGSSYAVSNPSRVPYLPDRVHRLVARFLRPCTHEDFTNNKDFTPMICVGPLNSYKLLDPLHTAESPSERCDLRIEDQGFRVFVPHRQERPTQ